MADQNQRISDLLDTLTDASSEEIETALRIYEPADVAAVVAERALAGGGGSGGSSSSLTVPATITGEDSNVGEVELTLTARPLQDTNADETNIFQVNASDGTELVGIDQTGTLDATAGVRVGHLDSGSHVQIGTDGAIQMFTNGSPEMSIKDEDASHVYLVVDSSSSFGTVQAYAPSSSKIALAVNSDGSTVDDADGIVYTGPPDYNGGEFRVTAGGAVVTAQNTAPADSNLRAGQVAIWFDSSNGAAKVNFKGKTEDGTVVAGQVALT